MFYPMPNLLPHFGGRASISLAPKTDKLIAKSREKHKFWDFDARIAQIEHKFFRCMLNPLPGEMELFLAHLRAFEPQNALLSPLFFVPCTP